MFCGSPCNLQQNTPFPSIRSNRKLSSLQTTTHSSTATAVLFINMICQQHPLHPSCHQRLSIDPAQQLQSRLNKVSSLTIAQFLDSSILQQPVFCITALLLLRKNIGRSSAPVLFLLVVSLEEASSLTSIVGSGVALVSNTKPSPV